VTGGDGDWRSPPKEDLHVPYRDSEDRRRYDRERKRRLRAADPVGLISVPPELKLRVAADVESLLTEAVKLVRAEARAPGIQKARALGYLASVAMRLIETQELQDRVEALERVLTARRAG
jgi:hypothetical protein